MDIILLSVCLDKRVHFTKWTNRLLGLLVILSLLLTGWVFWPYLWDRYRVVKDLQNFYWMALYQDPNLFAMDYLRRQQLLEMTVLGYPFILYPASLGYGLLFYLASFMIDHIWLSKWLIVILMPLCVIYLFKLGRLLEDNLTAASLSLLFIFFMLASYQSISLASGLQRAFAIPLLIVFFYYMARRQYVGAAVAIVLSALFYWPNVPLMVVTYGLSWLKVEPRFKMSLNINRIKLTPLIVSILLSVLLLALEIAVEFEVFVPKNISGFQNPNYQSQGATPMFINFPWLGRAGIFDAGTDLVNFIVLLILGGLIYKVVGRRSLQRLPGIYWCLLAAAIIMYAASFFVLLGLSSALLYQPSRYTRSTLFLLGLLFVGLDWGDFLAKAPRWFWRKAPLFIVITLAFVLAFLVIYLSPTRALLTPVLWFVGVILSGVFVVLGVSSLYWLIKGHQKPGSAGRLVAVVGIGLITISLGAFYIKTLGIRTIDPSKAERDIYEFVSALPKDTVLAGEPVIMSGIPLFSKRSVLFRDLHPNVNPNVNEFILNYFDAQYAESPKIILNFCERYEVSYLVLDTTDFSPEFLATGDFFYQPWNDKIVEMVSKRSNFVLPRLQPVFASGPLMVIQCDADTILAGN